VASAEAIAVAEMAEELIMMGHNIKIISTYHLKHQSYFHFLSTAHYGLHIHLPYY
jgi:hypothetical protein